MMTTFPKLIKVTLIGDDGKMIINSNMKCQSSFWNLLEFIKDEFSIDRHLPKQIYWTNGIENFAINNERSYDIFYSSSLSGNIFVRQVHTVPKIGQQQNNFESSLNEKFATNKIDDDPKKTKEQEAKRVCHPEIVCGACKKDVIGFRYKCVQCSDYNLCMDCEGEMKHANHVMFRIPVPNKNIHSDRKTLNKINDENTNVGVTNEPIKQDEKAENETKQYSTGISAESTWTAETIENGQYDQNRAVENIMHLNSNRVNEEIKSETAASLDDQEYQEDPQTSINSEQNFRELIRELYQLEEKYNKYQPPLDDRAKIVFHPEQRIDEAVHAMMAMGFSNDGQYLTSLLESVNGDISMAIDRLPSSK